MDNLSLTAWIDTYYYKIFIFYGCQAQQYAQWGFSPSGKNDKPRSIYMHNTLTLSTKNLSHKGIHGYSLLSIVEKFRPRTTDN